jgi:hypothetical protein
MKTETKLPLLFRQSPVKSMRMWKEGFSKLTPLDHSYAKRDGHLWAIFGATTFSLTFLVQVASMGSWLMTFQKAGVGIFVGAIAYLQFVEYRKETQKIKELNDMKQYMEGL